MGIIAVFGVLLLVVGGAFVAAGVLTYRGAWRPLNAYFPCLGSGILFMGCGILLWGGLAVTTGTLTRGGTRELVSALQWVFSFAGFGAFLLFAAGVFFGCGHLPRRLRPRWMTDADGTTDPVADGGFAVSLPRWSAAATGATLAASRGPLLAPEAVDWLHRNWSGRRWARFGATVAAAPLRALGMVDDDGRAAPEVLLASQPLQSGATTAYIVAFQPCPGAAGPRAAEMILRLGARNAVVLWQEEARQAQQGGLDDDRSLRQRLDALTGYGRRRGVDAAYRVDFVVPEAAGAWIADFLAATGGAGASWRIFLDRDQSLSLTQGGHHGEYVTGSGRTVTAEGLGRKLDATLRAAPA
ncbi:hypothetical protein [Zhihengliuella salsuginis]|uniref:Uncharacterized protein n=1 Tax=Zhihengliuella salsuginis TaxID=578222 RepID=A0ABQ3GA04_9MICC|nr:hypothetical protein [Zhihengliuella salsuginis]GHC99274.1 hypothetical protein GCM10008096_01250 [Zhihengliuella salsuginis]